jgi:hypothetical protein
VPPLERCVGTNCAVFKAERLSNASERLFVTYRLIVVRDTFVAERTPGRKWIGLASSTFRLRQLPAVTAMTAPGVTGRSPSPRAAAT